MNRTHTSPRWPQLALWLAIACLAAGCATQPDKLTDPVRDPWEPYNRNVHAFNDAVDSAIVKPVARAYGTVMPDPPQRGVRNFFRNLYYPVTFVNLLLQGKVGNSVEATGRFLMNSTFGLLGFFDVATRAGIADFDEDFGQTLAVWGWTDSRYFVLPFLGPSTLRDAAGRPADTLLSPVGYLAREESEYRPLILDLISLRAELLPFEDEIEAASDPYAFIRDVYLQNREYKIYDGDPPAPDYDAMLEE